MELFRVQKKSVWIHATLCNNLMVRQRRKRVFNRTMLLYWCQISVIARCCMAIKLCEIPFFRFFLSLLNSSGDPCGISFVHSDSVIFFFLSLWTLNVRLNQKVSRHQLNTQMFIAKRRTHFIKHIHEKKKRKEKKVKRKRF